MIQSVAKKLDQYLDSQYRDEEIDNEHKTMV